jgi:thioesterase domain-containing protein
VHLLQLHFIGATLALSDILNFPTLHAQAQRIVLLQAGERDDDVQVAHLAQGGNGVTLYCFPGTYGNGSEFAELAKALGTDRPVLSFVCHTLGPRRWDRKTIAEIAEDYARFIAARSAEQGCALLGWSFGGDLAYEVARQLNGLVAVTFLGVVDVTDRKQILALGSAAAAALQGATELHASAVNEWIERSAMKERWQQLLNDMSPAERQAVLSFLASESAALPIDGPSLDSKEYDMWVVIRLSWMKRRYAGEARLAASIPLHNWTAEATSQNESLRPRAWDLLAEVVLDEQIPGTTHKSILSHKEFINGVRNALSAGSEPQRRERASEK